MYMYVCVYIHIYISLYIYIYTHMYVWYAGGPEHVEDGHLEERGDTGDYEVPGAALPQLRFIHIHQLFRILYTLF